MKLKGMLTISGIIVIISVTVILSNNVIVTPPSIKDEMELNENTSIGLNQTDVPSINDNTKIINQNDNFSIDKNNTKHYIIKADDSPTLK